METKKTKIISSPTNQTRPTVGTRQKEYGCKGAPRWNHKIPKPVNNFAWLSKPTLGTQVLHTILIFGRGCFLSFKLACLVLEVLEANQGPTLDFLPCKLRIISNTRLCRLGRNNQPNALGDSDSRLCSEQIQGPILGFIQLNTGSAYPTGPEYLHVPCSHAIVWGLN